MKRVHDTKNPKKYNICGKAIKFADDLQRDMLMLNMNTIIQMSVGVAIKDFLQLVLCRSTWLNFTKRIK